MRLQVQVAAIVHVSLAALVLLLLLRPRLLARASRVSLALQWSGARGRGLVAPRGAVQTVLPYQFVAYAVGFYAVCVLMAAVVYPISCLAGLLLPSGGGIPPFLAVGALVQAPFARQMLVACRAVFSPGPAAA